MAAFFIAFDFYCGAFHATAMDKRNLREAVAFALAGEWDRAHEIAQSEEEDPTACWIHAVLHRIEGDLGNAHYWYRRARRTPPAELTPQAELEEILSSLR